MVFESVQYKTSALSGTFFLYLYYSFLWSLKSDRYELLLLTIIIVIIIITIIKQHV